MADYTDYTDYSGFDYSGASLYDTGYTPYNGGFGADAVSQDQYGNLYDSSGQYIGNVGGTATDSSQSASAPPADNSVQDFGQGQYGQYDPNANTNTFWDTVAGTTDVQATDGSWGSHTDAEGNVDTWDASGKVTTNFVNGDVAVINPDNSSSYTTAAGQVTNLDSQGNLILFVDPNAGYSYEFDKASGLWTEHEASGDSCTGDATGNYCCSDGTCTPAWQDKATNTNYVRQQAPAGSVGSGGGGGSKGGQPSPQPSIPQNLAQRLQQTGACGPNGCFPGTTIPRPSAQGASLQASASLGGSALIWIAIGVIAIFAITAKR
jgi:hypothetical protein